MTGSPEDGVLRAGSSSRAFGVVTSFAVGVVERAGVLLGGAAAAGGGVGVVDATCWTGVRAGAAGGVVAVRGTVGCGCAMLVCAVLVCAVLVCVVSGSRRLSVSSVDASGAVDWVWPRRST